MEESAQEQSIKFSRVNDKNYINELVSNEDDGLKHKRQLLLEIVRHRKVFTDPETGKTINDDTGIQTLLNIIQREKEKDEMETKNI